MRVLTLWRGGGGQQQIHHLYHGELVPKDLPEHHLVPGHLPGIPEEAVQQHAQEAPKGAQAQGIDGQVLIHGKNVEN